MQPARDAEQLDDDVDPIAEGLSAIIKGLKPGDRLPQSVSSPPGWV